MSKQKQTTLFQSWGSKAKKKNNSVGGGGTSGGRHHGDVVDLCGEEVEDEDLLLAMAMQESLRDSARRGDPGAVRGDDEPSTSGVYNTMISGPVKPLQPFRDREEVSGSSPAQFSDDSNDIYENMPLTSIPEATNVEDLPGFDKAAGRLWIYPTNYPVREYQYNIVKQSLFKNTLVVLPTGMGKTFIAAVVMFNYYRWYPSAKIVFMAPTKPLVAQQIEACYNIMGIPQHDTAEMTGAMAPAERQRSWRQRRVFFLTPQVLTNDLSRSALPADQIKCLVVDEAHKALGNHAYCQVVRELVKYNKDFRVLALSATPGSDIKAVQNVLSNLLISHVELRSEDSADIQPYTHERKVDKIVVPLGQELTSIREKYLQIITVTVSKLKRLGVLYAKEPKSLSKFLVLKAREAFRQNPPPNLQRSQFGAVEGDFALCMSLYHGYELLQLHGLRSLYNFMESLITGEKGYGRTKTELMRNANFMDLLEDLRGKFQIVRAANPNTQQDPLRASQLALPFVAGHPKMNKLCEIVVEHFHKFEAAGKTTRVMIFSQYRDSVNEITEMLNRHRPLCRVMSFIGQSSTGKASRGFSQKEQLKVMQRFREGGYNTLVSTCVGEEGLDIGDVDLIVCFDAHKSPIRLVQRMGRTGRKREGRIVMLVTEGKEEQIYNHSQSSKRSIHKAILNGAKSLLFYPNNPRMLPAGLDPQCHKMHITVADRFSVQTGRAKVKAQADKVTPMVPTKATRNKIIYSRKDGFLTAEELSYWNEHFKVDDNTAPSVRLRSSAMLSLNEPERLEDENKEVLSLSKWLPWQNRLQSTAVVSHSSRTKHLVELLEFMDVQSAVGGEDHYGEEMRLYLNMEDVLKPGQKNGAGILNFCTSAAKKDEKMDKKKTVKRSDTLPTFSSDEEADSDRDLPTLGDIIKGGGPNPLNELPGPDEAPGNSTAKRVSSTERPAEAPGNSTVKRVSSTEKPAEAPSSSTSKRVSSTEKHRSDDEPRHKTKGKRKKRMRTSDEQNTCIEVIEDKDNDDFEENVHPPDRYHKPEQVGGNEYNSGVMRVNQKETMAETPALPTLEGGTVCGGDIEKTFVGEESMDVAQAPDDVVPIQCGAGNKEREFPASFEVTPEMSPQRSSATNREIENTDEIGQANGSIERLNLSVIQPPPALEEVHDIFAELDRQGRVSPIDILDLIDEWQNEIKEFSQQVDSSRCYVPSHMTKESQTCHRKAVSGQKKMSVTSAKVVISDTKEQFDIKETSSSAKLGPEVEDKQVKRRNDKNHVDLKHSEFGNETKLGLNSELSHLELSAELTEEHRQVSPVNDLPYQKYCSETGFITGSVRSTPGLEADRPSDVITRLSPVSGSSRSVEHSGYGDSVKTFVDVKRRSSESSEGGAVSPVFLQKPTTQAASCNATSTPMVCNSHTKRGLETKFNIQDSFFESNQDDSIFERFKTPRGDQKKALCVDGHKKSQHPNTSQITFTQALACVHDSFNASGVFFSKGILASEAVGAVSGEDGQDSPCAGSFLRHSHSSSESTSVNDMESHLASKRTIRETTAEKGVPQDGSEEEADVDDEPNIEAQFDLGIDFDDEVDELVPPSPTSTQPFSQASKLSMTTDLSKNVSPGLIGGMGVKFSQPNAEDKSCPVAESSNTCAVLKESEVVLNKFLTVVSEEKTDTAISQPFESKVVSEKKSLSSNVKLHTSNSADKVKTNTKTANEPLFEEEDGIFSEILTDPDVLATHTNQRSNAINEPVLVSESASLVQDTPKTSKLLPEAASSAPLSRSPPLSQSKRHAHSCDSTPIARVAPRMSEIGSNTVGDEINSREGSKDIQDPDCDADVTTVNPLADMETMDISALDFEESMAEHDGNSEYRTIPEYQAIPESKAIPESRAQATLLDDSGDLILTQNQRRLSEHDLNEKTILRQNVMTERTSNKVSSAENLMADMETMDISVQDFEDDFEEEEAPKEFQQQQNKEHGVDEFSDEESIIQVKKKSRALMTSPDTPDVDAAVSRFDDSEFKTPVKPAPRNKKRPKVLSESECDDSPAVKPKKRKSALEILDLTFGNDDEDFEIKVPGNALKRCDPRTRNESTVNTGREKRPEIRKKKRTTHAARFIEHEAELSGEDTSDDEEDSDADTYDMSFVNDVTHFSQERDMRAIYMQSVRSPELARGRFKLQYAYDDALDVFSQTRGDSDDSYEEDSFCVRSEDLNESEFVDDPTLLEASKLLPRMRKRTTRNSNKTLLGEDAAKGRGNAKGCQGKRRVRRHSSSSEEEGERLFTQVPGCRGEPQAKNRISSTESSSASHSFDTSPPALAAKNCIKSHIQPNDSINHDISVQAKSAILKDRAVLAQTSVIPVCDKNDLNKPSSGSPFTPTWTEMPSLQSRCQMRLNNKPNSERHAVSMGNISNIPQHQSAVVARKEADVCNELNFDLSFDVGLLDDECDMVAETSGHTEIKSETRTPSVTPQSTKGSIVTSQSMNFSSRNTSKTSAVFTPTMNTSSRAFEMSPIRNQPGCPGTQSPCGALNSSGVMTKEERLRLSRLKQEEFRKKFAEKQKNQEMKSGHGPDILNESLSVGAPDAKVYSAYASPMPSASVLHSMSSTEASSTKKLTVFVDSREINGAQDCISVLRAKHQFNTVVAQLKACDYIVSNRMAVERKLVGDFTNGAQKAKLVERIRDMSEHYEKLVIIVEKERVKKGEKDSQRPLLRSKYVETLLAALSQMQVKVYFSESQENTADVIAQLADVERRKGKEVTARTCLTPPQQERLKFYLSLPKVSYVTALNLLHGYKSIKEFMNSSAVIIEKRGCISKAKAESMHRFMRHCYDPQMLGIK